MYSTNPVSHRGTYVVTYDVASRLQSFSSASITVPNQDDPIFENFHLRLFELLAQALPDVTIDTIEMSELRRKIWEQVGRRIGPNHAVLSTCPEIASANTMPGETLLLNINRLCNADGEIIGYGPRPGFNFLKEQLDELAYTISGRSVILIEDGAFTGGTLRSVLKDLHDRNVHVSTLIVGFCCTRAKAVLQEVFDGELVIINPIENLIDWIPDHDLIPFVPNCGRILGEQMSHSFMPVTKEGVSCSYPYILPFGKIEEWASLPTESAKTLSRFCLNSAMEIFSGLEAQSGHLITVKELLGTNPRVSLPVLMATFETPSLEVRVVDFLKEMLDKIL